MDFYLPIWIQWILELKISKKKLSEKPWNCNKSFLISYSCLKKIKNTWWHFFIEVDSLKKITRDNRTCSYIKRLANFSTFSYLSTESSPPVSTSQTTNTNGTNQPRKKLNKTPQTTPKKPNWSNSIQKIILKLNRIIKPPKIFFNETFDPKIKFDLLHPSKWSELSMLCDQKSRI